ncbi:MAG: GNAT family N-acetyltransferase [Cognaticolwellia sp.]
MADITQAFSDQVSAETGASVLSFRRARASDKAFLLNLRKASMDEHLKAAGIFLDDQAHMLRIDEFFSDSHVILLQNIAIGLLKLGQFSDHIHVRQFQLLPKYHGVGIGSRVLGLLKRKAAAKQRTITLNVLLENPARQLYLRHGFVVTGINKLEYSMRWQAPN